MKNTSLVALNEQEMMAVSGGAGWRCYAGSIGMAVGGGLVGGPIGYWAAGAVGLATFC